MMRKVRSGALSSSGVSKTTDSFHMSPFHPNNLVKKREGRIWSALNLAGDVKNDVDKLLQEDTIQKKLQVFKAWHCDASTVDMTSENPIGKGEFGSVYECRFNGHTCAIKMVNPLTVENVRLFVMECSNMVSLQHPNLLQMQACHISSSICFHVTEFASNGSLHDCILSNEMNLTLNTGLLSLLIGTAAGITYLHTRQNPILHRDIKPENILVRMNFSAVLSDFGEAQELEDRKSEHTNKIVGTPFYIAPEVLREETSSKKSDVFSFGMVLFVVSTFYHYRLRLTKEFCALIDIARLKPYPTKLSPVQICFKYGEKKHLTVMNAVKMMNAGWRPKLPPPFQNTWLELANLIQKCWNPLPEERPTINEVLSELQDIQQKTTGDEDGYLGRETFHLRKACLKIAFDCLNHEQNLDRTIPKYKNLGVPFPKYSINPHLTISDEHVDFQRRMGWGMYLERQLPSEITLRDWFLNYPETIEKYERHNREGLFQLVDN
eukprot:g84.t1